jgi:hypothetical protein
MKQLPLFPKRFILLINMSSRHLKRHIFICNLGDIRDKKYPGEAKDENTDGQVHPLHALQCLDVIIRRGEECIRA